MGLSDCGVSPCTSKGPTNLRASTVNSFVPASYVSRNPTVGSSGVSCFRLNRKLHEEFHDIHQHTIDIAKSSIEATHGDGFDESYYERLSAQG